MHYLRLRRYGSVEAVKFKRGDPQANFWDKVDKSGECWIWTGSREERGYGYFNLGGRIIRTHRLSYQWLVGPIPPGMQLDHLCREKSCVRPEHLRFATNKENGENHAGAQRNSKSGVRGVTWHSRIGKWQGTVTHHKRQIHVGYFETVEEAESAVRAKRNELFTRNDIDHS